MEPQDRYMAFCKSLKEFNPDVHEAVTKIYTAIQESETELAMRVDAKLNPLPMPPEGTDTMMPSDPSEMPNVSADIGAPIAEPPPTEDIPADAPIDDLMAMEDIPIGDLGG